MRIRFVNAGSNPFPWAAQYQRGEDWITFSQHNTRELLVELVSNHYVHFFGATVFCDVVEDGILYTNRLTGESLFVELS